MRLKLWQRGRKENFRKIDKNKDIIWRGRRDLNSRPPAWQAGVLSSWTTTPPQGIIIIILKASEFQYLLIRIIICIQQGSKPKKDNRAAEDSRSCLVFLWWISLIRTEHCADYHGCIAFYDTGINGPLRTAGPTDIVSNSRLTGGWGQQILQIFEQ